MPPDPYASRYAHLGEDLRWMHDVPDGMPVLLEPAVVAEFLALVHGA